MISILTPTGARPEAFAACAEMMRAQTYQGPVKWVIVDDGPEMTPLPEVEGWNIHYVRPRPLWSEGQNTQARNILAGLVDVTDRVVIVEDDDEYAPWWLERCNEWLDSHDLVGEAPSLYVHANGRERNMGNRSHASLCSTALKGEAVTELAKVCGERTSGIDVTLWRQFKGAKKIYPPEPRGVIGLKGGPGRSGIGVGHRM